MVKTVAIDDIIIRPNRQRKTTKDVDPQFIASVNRRLINPIILISQPDGIVLCAGERRLIALRAGSVTDLIENVHFRFFADLNSDEAEIIELEENVKREDLHWRDHVAAVGRIHAIFKARDETWTDRKTAQEINTSRTSIKEHLMIFRNLDNTALRDATGTKQAYSILQGIAERRTVSIVQAVTKVGSEIFDIKAQSNDPSGNNSPSPIPNSNPSHTSRLSSPIPSSPIPPDIPPMPDKEPEPSILNTDFIKWISGYSGDKFTLIHCDFPYDVKYDSYAKSISSVTDDYDFSGFWPLIDALCGNLDKIMSYSAHMMFWFSMKFYEQTKGRLEKAGLYVHDHPFVWQKTDNAGIIPGRDGIFPRRIYETAFLCSRGRRPLVKSLANCYGAPMQSNSIHPSTKPVPVLKHFFAMLIDETTDVLDPTAGSGNSLIAAEDMGARKILGLEINPTYATAAQSALERFRVMRKISK